MILAHTYSFKKNEEDYPISYGYDNEKLYINFEDIGIFLGEMKDEFMEFYKLQKDCLFKARYFKLQKTCRMMTGIEVQIIEDFCKRTEEMKDNTEVM